MKLINDLLSFLLELAMLIAFSYAGFHLGANKLLQYGLGIGAPLIAVLFWARWMAPKSNHQLPYPWLLIVTFVLFEGAALCLFLSGLHLWAAIQAVASLINVGLRFAWQIQR